MAEQKFKVETGATDELVIRTAYELTALVSLLEKFGILTRAELLEEIRSLHNYD
jgi:hypothetical protein